MTSEKTEKKSEKKLVKKPKKSLDLSTQNDVPVINTNDTDDTDNGAENNTHNTYRMFSGMSLDEIQEFLNEVSQKLTTDDLVYVNLAEADTVSTSIVQAIISLNRFAGHTQKTIKWQNPSAGFSDAFNNLGFYSEMMRLEFA